MKITVLIEPENDIRDVSIVSNHILKALERRNYDVEADITPDTGIVSIAIKNAFKREAKNG